jgi:hypothetical protein
MKCAGLFDKQLARVADPASNLSLLSLLRHVANNERYWYKEIFPGGNVPAHFGSDTLPCVMSDRIDTLRT